MVSNGNSASKYFQMMCQSASVHLYCVLCLCLEVIKMLDSILEVISDNISQENLLILIIFSCLSGNSLFLCASANNFV